MSKFIIRAPLPHTVDPEVFYVEANRMEVRDGMVQFFEKYHSRTPFTVVPNTCIVTQEPD